MFEISKPPRGLNRGVTVKLWFHLPRQWIFLHVMIKSTAAYWSYFCLTETVELRFQNKRGCLRSDNTAEERTVVCVAGVWKGREREKRKTRGTPLAFLSRLKLPFPKLPFPSLSNACHAGQADRWGNATFKQCFGSKPANHVSSTNAPITSNYGAARYRHQRA